MNSFIAVIVFGIIISILGIINMTGNVATIHWYHRTRIKKEDIKKYGMLVGVGTLIIGISIILAGILQMIFELESLEYITIIGLVIGLTLFVYAQFKYNKGIF